MFIVDASPACSAVGLADEADGICLAGRRAQDWDGLREESDDLPTIVDAVDDGTGDTQVVSVGEVDGFVAAFLVPETVRHATGVIVRSHNHAGVVDAEGLRKGC